MARQRVDEVMTPVRPGPGVLFLGAGVLLFRTIALLAGGARRVLQPWVVALTWVEMALDAITMLLAARWWVSGSDRHAAAPSRVGAMATLLHAARVAVFVLGRTGPPFDFDVRPEARADHDQRWNWTQVVVAGVLSGAGVLAVVVIWSTRRRSGRGHGRSSGARR
jgi:hypothetical protein